MRIQKSYSFALFLFRIKIFSISPAHQVLTNLRLLAPKLYFVAHTFFKKTLITKHRLVSLFLSAIKEIRNVFAGLQTLYGSYFPKVDPALIHDLLIRMQADPEKTPFYMVEIFTKPGTDSEAMRDYILQKTGMVPAIYDNGTHYVVNQRLTLEFLKELSDSERIIDVSGDYTGAVTGRGASRESRGIEHKD